MTTLPQRPQLTAAQKKLPHHATVSTAQLRKRDECDRNAF